MRSWVWSGKFERSAGNNRFRKYSWGNPRSIDGIARWNSAKSAHRQLKLLVPLFCHPRSGCHLPSWRSRASLLGQCADVRCSKCTSRKPERCIRLLIHVNVPNPQVKIYHTYLRQAQNLHRLSAQSNVLSPAVQSRHNYYLDKWDSLIKKRKVVIRLTIRN